MAPLGNRIPHTLSPSTVEALALLADCDAPSINAFGLSKLMTAGTLGSEWRRTIECQEIIRVLAAHQLLERVPSLEDRRTSEQCWHWRFDRERIRARLAWERAEVVIVADGPRVRPSALAC